MSVLPKNAVSNSDVDPRQSLRTAGRHLPERSGVYIMMDKYGNIVYVGKAVNLRRRVGSYTTPSGMRDRKVSKLVACFHSLSYIETNSELEALLVESRLIKANQPTFNRKLVEPESCCYLRANMRDEIPRIEIIPRWRNDNATYLGPFWSSSQIRDALEAVENIFQLRRCSDGNRHSGKQAACIYHELKKCSGPCAGVVSSDEYNMQMSKAWATLSGNPSEAVSQLTMRRDLLSDELRFEEAYNVHRQIRILESLGSISIERLSPGDDFAVVVPSYLKRRPVVLIFSHGRMKGQLMAGPRTYPDAGMLATRISKLHSSDADLLPGKPTQDDYLIIRSYLRCHGLEHSLVPLRSEILMDEMVDELLSKIDSMRRNGTGRSRE